MRPVLAGPAVLPLRWGATVARFTLLHFDFGGDRWVAAYIGDLNAPEPMPLRIESACVFGHILHSQQCDCGSQLDLAMRLFAESGRGLLIYGVDQDARGLGTAAHFSIYQMRQQENLDTADVFERLGAPWDNRNYGPVLVILEHLGISAVSLLSNNESRLRFLRENGIEASMAALEVPLDLNNMSTLMLEKEDLGYRWSFETHADWLEPMQREVLDDPDRSVACIVAVGQGMTDAGEVVVRGDVFDLASAFTGRIPADRRPGPLVAYFTDLPPIDDVARLRALDVDVLVVPFNPVPADLVAAGEAAGVRVVDWSRRNAYAVERPQWQLDRRADDIDVYRRGDRVRVVLRGEPSEAWAAELRRSPGAAGERWYESEVSRPEIARPANAGAVAP